MLKTKAKKTQKEVSAADSLTGQVSLNSRDSSRRDFLFSLLGGTGAALLTHRSLLFAPTVLGQDGGANGSKFMQIFLLGGWDSALTTDPVIPGSGKFAQTTYDIRYKQSTHGEFLGAPFQIAGKNNIWLGPGLEPARSLLSQVPVAVVNGMKVEVTAHELATNYLYSGQLSLSRSREYPASIAMMAKARGGFPAHIILGQGIPLAETGVGSPPLQTIDTKLLQSMLAGPYGSTLLKERTIASAHRLIEKLNKNYEERQTLAARASLSPWKAAEKNIGDIYQKRFDLQLNLTDEIAAKFVTGGKTDTPGAKLAVGAMALRAGLTSYVTVNFGGFDTHSNHSSTHLPLLKSFAQSLSGLLEYMMAEVDPDIPTKKLIETTTILITSEFVRTPQFNGAGGTDHWQVGSAMLLGAKVNDNSVIGATGDGAESLPYRGYDLLPEHLHATILRSQGYTQEAKLISEVHLDGLFV